MACLGYIKSLLSQLRGGSARLRSWDTRRYGVTFVYTILRFCFCTVKINTRVSISSGCPSHGEIILFGRKASASSFGSTGAARHPRLRVCPMGWQLAVDVIQEAHLELVRRAGLIAPSVHLDRAIMLNRLFPSQVGPFGRNFQSVYVDNWDQKGLLAERWLVLLLINLLPDRLLFAQSTPKLGSDICGQVGQWSSAYAKFGCRGKWRSRHGWIALTSTSACLLPDLGLGCFLG
eukprot:1857442-Amphidinium_carterae.1